MIPPHAAIWAIAGLATAGVILRPFQWPEAVWAVSGAVLLVALGLLRPADALAGIARGNDVYLFLSGMMLLAELAREKGLFDFLAAIAARRAKGSPARLFLLTYGVGICVTVFLSNDATAVVLTPAVAAVAKAARAENALPYLLVCAFIANAASFVLPISNPANLVIYGSQMPPLLQWLPRFALPSALSILATFLLLRWTQRRELRQPIARDVDVPKLSAAGKVAALGIAGTSLALLSASSLGLSLGWPSAASGVLTCLAVLLIERTAPWTILTGISWGILPLVAGLFVLVEALDRTGLIRDIGMRVGAEAQISPAQAAWAVGLFVAGASNLVNNLPSGLIAGAALQGGHVAGQVTGAALIGVDLGPNLSVTGSLATILWLTALRREGLHVSAWQFLKLGLLIMPPALLLALGAITLIPG